MWAILRWAVATQKCVEHAERNTAWPNAWRMIRPSITVSTAIWQVMHHETAPVPISRRPARDLESTSRYFPCDKQWTWEQGGVGGMEWDNVVANRATNRSRQHTYAYEGRG